MNRCVLIGRLVADPETKQTQSGTLVARYRLAVDRKRGKDGEREADFLNCVAFAKGAEFAQKHLTKGTRIAVEGRIQTGSYEKDGQKVYTTDIVVERHEFCESKGASAPVQAAPAQATQAAPADGFALIDDESDLPF